MAFTVISVLGIVVFDANDWPVSLVFAGLTCVYVSEFFAGFFVRVPRHSSRLRSINIYGERATGLFRLLTGTWLMYMTFAATLDAATTMHVPI